MTSDLPHDVSERGGQSTEFGRRVDRRRDRRNLRLQTLNRRDEAISPAWNVADVSCGALPSRSAFEGLRHET
jgi:hypothetical protein